ncbi:MAG: RNA polymerase sigma factor [Polyangiaceae bacterium]|nr:RNA polymerase sigma factor [Polyangiaceae bacterium]
METSPDQVQTSERTAGALSPDFRELFDAEFDYVCRSLRRLGVREADLKDVAQELFVAVHGRMRDYDRARPIRPWLFSFAVRYASNYRRLGRNRNHDAHDESALPTEHRPALEARDLVLRALGRLDFDRQTIVVMHDMEGFDAPEIAAQLGIPVNTVYSRIRLARADFREAVDHLQKKGGTP